jgi:hypothetical protein
VPRAFEDERGLRRQKKDRKWAFKGKKGPTKVKIKKVPRANESLNPVLILPIIVYLVNYIRKDLHSKKEAKKYTI